MTDALSVLALRWQVAGPDLESRLRRGVVRYRAGVARRTPPPRILAAR